MLFLIHFVNRICSEQLCQWSAKIRNSGLSVEHRPVLEEAKEMSRQRIPAEDLPKLPVQQLSQIKEQLDSELQVLNDSLENIRTAATKYEAAGETLRGLSSQSSGNLATKVIF